MSKIGKFRFTHSQIVAGFIFSIILIDLTLILSVLFSKADFDYQKFVQFKLKTALLLNIIIGAPVVFFLSNCNKKTILPVKLFLTFGIFLIFSQILSTLDFVMLWKNGPQEINSTIQFVKTETCINSGGAARYCKARGSDDFWPLISKRIIFSVDDVKFTWKTWAYSKYLDITPKVEQYFSSRKNSDVIVIYYNNKVISVTDARLGCIVYRTVDPFYQEKAVNYCN